MHAVPTAALSNRHPDRPLAQHVQRLPAHCSYADADRRVILGDGATWILNLAYGECPGAIQIVNLWHAEKKLSNSDQWLRSIPVRTT